MPSNYITVFDQFEEGFFQELRWGLTFEKVMWCYLEPKERQELAKIEFVQIVTSGNIVQMFRLSLELKQKETLAHITCSVTVNIGLC